MMEGSGSLEQQLEATKVCYQFDIVICCVIVHFMCVCDY